ncbi:hypothetical protein ACFQU7_30305 [Pseudoroseomonas wenyumeiae]
MRKVVAAAAADEALRAQLTQQGFTLVGSGPDEFRNFLQSDIAKWAEVVRMTGATID